jgi:hypothetical protein
MTTEYVSGSYREWLREGPDEATATGPEVGMLVLTPAPCGGKIRETCDLVAKASSYREEVFCF